MLHEDKTHCAEWTRWYEGLTPNEHRHMVSLSEERAAIKRHNKWMTVIGLGGLGLTVLTIIIGTYVNLQAADQVRVIPGPPVVVTVSIDIKGVQPTPQNALTPVPTQVVLTPEASQ